MLIDALDPRLGSGSGNRPWRRTHRRRSANSRVPARRPTSSRSSRRDARWRAVYAAIQDVRDRLKVGRRSAHAHRWTQHLDLDRGSVPAQHNLPCLKPNALSSSGVARIFEPEATCRSSLCMECPSEPSISTAEGFLAYWTAVSFTWRAEIRRTLRPSIVETTSPGLNGQPCTSAGPPGV